MRQGSAVCSGMPAHRGHAQSTSSTILRTPHHCIQAPHPCWRQSSTPSRGPACIRSQHRTQTQPPRLPLAAAPGLPHQPRQRPGHAPAAPSLLLAGRNAPLLPLLLPLPLRLPPLPLHRPAAEAPPLPRAQRLPLLGRVPARLPLRPAGAPRQPGGHHHLSLLLLPPRPPRQIPWAATLPRPAQLQPPPRAPPAAAPGTAPRSGKADGGSVGNTAAALREHRLECEVTAQQEQSATAHSLQSGSF